MIFAYHGYPWLIHRLTYRRTNHRNIHVRGYKEEGTITTPFDMAVLNDLDRFHLAADALVRLPQLGARGDAIRSAAGGEADGASRLHPSARRGPAGDSRLAMGSPTNRWSVTGPPPRRGELRERFDSSTHLRHQFGRRSIADPTKTAAAPQRDLRGGRS